ncbi:MAG: hypothetical protein H6742_07440 [Alphaproteobacteria bacterium]|nr:hypothetical protein [Alphaproteobacteria bacterium]
MSDDVSSPMADATADDLPPAGGEDRDGTTGDAGAPSRPDSGLGDAGGMLGSAVLSLARVLFRRGRKTAKRAAEGGRVRLDLRQLRRDRDVMYQKLGREVRTLIEGGELRHPGLERGIGRIEELEARIAEVEAEIAARAEAARVEAARGESSGEAADEESADELEAGAAAQESDGSDPDAAA